MEEKWENGIVVRLYVNPLTSALTYVVDLDNGRIYTATHNEVERCRNPLLQYLAPLRLRMCMNDASLHL